MTTRTEEMMMVQNTINFGETREDAEYVDEILQTILRACKQAKDEADDVATGRADLVASLTGCLTLLGFVAPVGVSSVDHLCTVLLASADFESSRSEAILNARGGDCHSRASVHSARRGILHVCAEEIDAAIAHLTEVEAWYAQRAARQGAR